MPFLDARGIVTSYAVGGRSLTCPAGSHGFNAIAFAAMDDVGACNPMDDNDHGTHTSGTIGAVGNNGTGVVGVNWTAKIMGLKFLDSGGSGSVGDAVNAIEFAIRVKAALSSTNGANVRVLSNSSSDAFAESIERTIPESMIPAITSSVPLLARSVPVPV